MTISRVARDPTTVEVRLGDPQAAGAQLVNPTLGGTAARVATSVEVHTYPIESAGVVIKRILSSGHKMDEAVSDGTRVKANQVFQKLKGLIGEQLIQSGTLSADRVQMLRVQVDVERQVAKWWLEGDFTVHELFLGHQEDLHKGEAIYQHMNLLATTIGAETRRGREPLARLTKGVHGDRSEGRALSYRPMDGGLPIVGKESDKLPQTFDLYAEKHLEKAMDGKTKDEVVAVMKEMAKAELFRDRTMKFLEGQIKEREKWIAETKRNNPASSSLRVDDETKTIQQLRERLHMFQGADMFALQSFLVHKGVGHSITDAETVADAIGKEMRTIAGIHKERSVFNPKNIWREEEELPREAQEYANRIGSWAIEDPIVHYRYCELHHLDPNKHMAVEQGFLLNDNRNFLFEDIRDLEFQRELTAMFGQVEGEVTALHRQMEGITATEVPATIAEARKFHKEALTPTSLPTVVTPRSSRSSSVVSIASSA